MSDTRTDTLAELRDRIEAQAREIEELKKDRDGWKAHDRVRVKLGEIIGDPYAERSMWPRLHRLERWWGDMKRQKEAAEARVAALTEALRTIYNDPDNFLCEKADQLCRALTENTDATPPGTPARRVYTGEDARKIMNAEAFVQGARLARWPETNGYHEAIARRASEEA